MKFLGFFNKIKNELPIAATVASYALPQFAPIINAAVKGMLTAEASFPPGTPGQLKHEYWLDIVSSELPVAIGIFEQASGKNVVDDERFKAGLAKMKDGFNDMFQATNYYEELRKKALETVVQK